MRRRIFALSMIAAALLLFMIAAHAATTQAAPPADTPTGNPGRGAYLFTLAAGCGCHQGAAGFLAGGEAFEGPFGKIYPPNITSDAATGIGTYSEADIVRVLREGKRPDGSQLFPIMPYPAFSGMSEQDQYDLAAFIKTAPAVSNKLPASVYSVPIPPFSPPPQPADAPTGGVARGEYIVNTISHCGDCHTPTGPTGAPDFSKFLGGNTDFGSANITPSNEFGIGTWSQEQIYLLLKTGKRPNGTQVGGLMELVINGGLKDITQSDGFAVAAYLKTIPAVDSAPVAAPPQTLPTTGNVLNQTLLGAMLAFALVLLASGAWLWRSARRVN